jgi:hypothetical protein
MHGLIRITSLSDNRLQQLYSSQRSVDSKEAGREGSAPKSFHRADANVFSLADGSIRQRPLGEVVLGSAVSLAQGKLHRDGPGTEESSPSPLTPGGPPLEMGREVRATKGRPEEARRDGGAVLQPHTTDEGGEPQGFRKGAATGPTGGKGEASVRIC